VADRISGTEVEARVAAHLERRGYRILARNFRTRFGEIDLVVQKGSSIRFVEVRARASGRFLRPAETVDARKQARLRRTAETFLARRGAPRAEQVFFDVASVVGDDLEYIEGAFE
jgi:putative endonuclease